VTARSIEDYIEGFGITVQGDTGKKAAEAISTPTTQARPDTSKAPLDREIIGKDGAPMVLIPAGEFLMGSPDGEGDEDEHPRHQVYLDAIYMDRFEVTVARYAEFLRSTNRSKPDHWAQVETSKHDKLPVVGVNWDDADTYCRWAGKRLPTEAEWEKAARGTDGQRYPWGNDGPSAMLANYGRGYSSKVYVERLVPVDSYEPGKSPWGLYHMAGNLWEWVADWYDKSYYIKSPQDNPKGPSSGQYRVLRGGSWNNDPEDVRSAYRSRYARYRPDTIGFRCAQDIPK
jgi:formylglycine-generating enzyme required for sulfatase activity